MTRSLLAYECDVIHQVYADVYRTLNSICTPEDKLRHYRSAIYGWLYKYAAKGSRYLVVNPLLDTVERETNWGCKCRPESDEKHHIAMLIEMGRQAGLLVEIESTEGLMADGPLMLIDPPDRRSEAELVL